MLIADMDRQAPPSCPQIQHVCVRAGAQEGAGSRGCAFGAIRSAAGYVWQVRLTAAIACAPTFEGSWCHPVPTLSLWCHPNNYVLTPQANASASRCFDHRVCCEETLEDIAPHLRFNLCCRLVSEHRLGCSLVPTLLRQRPLRPCQRLVPPRILGAFPRELCALP